MRYWSLRETNRVIAVDILLSPRWLEISREEFILKRLEFPLSNKEVYLLTNKENCSIMKEKERMILL